MDSFREGLLPALSKAENDSLIRQYKETNDINIKEKIIAHNLRLISLTINNYFCAVDIRFHDDMFSEGMRGLSDAIELFEPEQKFAFSSYAVPAIKRKIARFLMLEEKHKDIISLDTPVEGQNGEQDASLVDFIQSDEDLLEEQTANIDVSEKMKVVKQFVSSLKPKYQEVFIRAWGLNGRKETHNVIAEDLGITHQRVAQMVSKTLRDLQRFVLAHGKLSAEERKKLKNIVIGQNSGENEI